MKQDAFVERLNALAALIPPGAFRVEGALNCSVYVLVDIDDGGTIDVGEGQRNRETMQFKRRGKRDKAFDDHIAQRWGKIALYRAISNVTKAVSAEFEIILSDELKPLFPNGRLRSIWRAGPFGEDRRAFANPAERIDFDFRVELPGDKHDSIWKAKYDRTTRSWEEIPLDWIITRRSERPKDNRTKPHEIAHFESYPPLGGTTTVAAHRAKNEAHPAFRAKRKPWEHIKANLWWDATYPDQEGPIITITPPRAG
jgi:hypothetical protein